MVGPPVMQPKAGAVKAPELSPRGRGHSSKLTAPAFASMTGGPNRWLALLSCSQRQVQLRHRSSVREGEGILVIKLVGLVRVDATHQSTALDISLFTHFKWTTTYGCM